MAEERKLFKDWFDREAARRMAAQVAGAWPEFDKKAFIRRATTGLDPLEFHGRIAAFSDALRTTLPEDVPRSLDILTRSLPSTTPDASTVTDGWLQWPLGHFIAAHGTPYFEESMAAMIELTQRFTAEFAVRPFLQQYPERTMRRLLKLTTHPNVHVRRWCSEGCRPRLPWGRRLDGFVADPSPLWPILEALKDDPERYVQKSVANNLNDIGKDHPDALVNRCRAWNKSAGPDRRWIIRHALRTLIKDGHPATLALLGYRRPKGLKARVHLTPAAVCVGGTVNCAATVENGGSSPMALVIDYAVHYPRQKGRTGRKVFKWTTLTLPAGGRVALRKRHSMRETSVRALYPGRHLVELQINGQVLASGAFQLL